MKIINCKQSVCMGLAGILLLISGGVAAQTDKPKPVTYKDWAHVCEKPPVPEGQQAPADQCYIYQNISVKDTNKRLLHLAIGFVGKENKPAAVLTLPLGIFLPPGLAFGVDKNKPVNFPVQACIRAGCRAVLPLGDELIAQMKKGKQGQVRFFDGQRREIGIPISLLGFTAGFNALSR